MNYNIILWFISFILFSNCSNSDVKKNNGRKIVVEAVIDKHFYMQLNEIFDIKDKIRISYVPVHFISLSPPVKYLTEEVVGGKVKWEIFTDQPIKVSPPFGTSIIMAPGDSVLLSYRNNTPIYTGNKKQSLTLLNALMYLEENLSKPKKRYSHNVSTLPDFIEWSQYVDTILSKQLSVIDSFKSKILLEEYDFYRIYTAGKYENDRVSAFSGLYDSIRHGYPGLNYNNLNEIWDSTQYKPTRNWLRSVSMYYGSIYDFYTYITLDVCRKFNFDINVDSLKSQELHAYLLFMNAKNNYKGQVRERLMANILNEQTIIEMGINNSMTQSLLKDYYSQPGFSEYKNIIKGIVRKQQK